MDLIFGPPMSLDVSENQRAYNAHVKLIRKLRWIGMEDAAARVQTTLGENPRSADSVVACPMETE
jgi:hypothetical protein